MVFLTPVQEVKKKIWTTIATTATITIDCYYYYNSFKM